MLNRGHFSYSSEFPCAVSLSSIDGSKTLQMVIEAIFQFL